MDYKITMLTVSQQIGVGTTSPSKYAPWSNVSGTITFHNPQMGAIIVSDDDNMLNTGLYATDSTGQELTSDTVFGYGASAQTIPAGTRISNFIGSILRHEDADGNRYDYAVIFPRTYVSGKIGEVLGNQYSVLIFPHAAVNAQGEPIDPVPFDPANSFRFVDTSSPQRAADGRLMTEAEVPCFVAGTVIETPYGGRPIESLTAGDLIRTRDHGLRWLRWIGRTYLDAATLDRAPQLRPIRIRAGALAPGMPGTDLQVSPQHRVLVRSAIARRMFGEDEILVAAKHLLALPGVETVCPPNGVTYFHMLFDDHEIVRSNGAWTESLYVGPRVRTSLGDVALRELFALFPELADPDFRPPAARRFLTGREGRKLAQRHARNRKQLIEA